MLRYLSETIDRADPELAEALAFGYGVLAEAEAQEAKAKKPEEDSGNSGEASGEKPEQSVEKAESGEGPGILHKAATLAGSVVASRITDKINSGERPDWKDILGDSLELGITVLPGIGGVSKLAKALKATAAGAKVAQVAEKVGKSAAAVKALKAVNAAKGKLSPENQKRATKLLLQAKKAAIQKAENELQMDFGTVGNGGLKGKVKDKLKAEVNNLKSGALKNAASMVMSAAEQSGTKEEAPEDKAIAAVADWAEKGADPKALAGNAQNGQGASRQQQGNEQENKGAEQAQAQRAA